MPYTWPTVLAGRRSDRRYERGLPGPGNADGDAKPAAGPELLDYDPLLDPLWVGRIDLWVLGKEVPRGPFQGLVRERSRLVGRQTLGERDNRLLVRDVAISRDGPAILAADRRILGEPNGGHFAILANAMLSDTSS